MIQINSNLRQLEHSECSPILQKVGKNIDKFKLTEMNFKVNSGKSLEITMTTYNEKTIDKIMKTFETVMNGVQNEA